MNTLGANQTSRKKSQGSKINPFAKALAETEQRLGNRAPNPTDDNKLLGEALARTGGNLGETTNTPQEIFNQQELVEKQKKQQRRQELHAKINPIEQQDVFDARQKKVQQEIDKIRQELKLLAKDVAKFHKEIDVTLTTQVVDPGQDGKYHLNFFHKLRQFIAMLRSKIKSARTWAKQTNKKKKKKRKFTAGIEMKGAKHEQTKALYDMFGNERGVSFGGG
ncbi:MAG: hypothetical protein GF390_01275 [Candidatus Pacebacteria bacterium]|nr:hypothetical protein [Candidatus Paceibacterota bacterium]